MSVSKRFQTAMLPNASTPDEKVRLMETVLRINAALIQASDESEILAALALYTDDAQPQTLALDYIDFDAEGKNASITLVAIRNKGETRTPAGVLLRKLSLDHLSFSTHWRNNPFEPLFVEDVEHDARLDDTSRAEVQPYGIQSMVVIPLQANGRWHGLLTVTWTHPRAFDEAERYIYTALLHTIAATVAARRAFLAEQAARLEVERERERSDMIARVNAALAQAMDEERILAAVAPILEHWGATNVTLGYVEMDEQNRFAYVDTVALRDLHQSISLDTMSITRFTIEAFPILNQFLVKPNTVLLIEDMQVDFRIHDEALPAYTDAAGSGAMIIMPLRMGERWLGLLTFAWETAQTFDPELVRILNILQPIAAAVVGSRRMFLQMVKVYRTTEKRLQTLIDNAPLILAAIDKHGFITLSEGAGLLSLGLQPGQVVGLNVFDLFGSIPNVTESITRAMHGETVSFVSESNNSFFESVYAPLYDPNGEQDGVIGMSLDVTDRMRAEKERERLIRMLRETARFKDQFMAMMSHELRTPLNAIIGLLGIVLMENTELSSDTLMLLQRARMNSDRLLTLINNILDVSRMEAGRMQIVPSPVVLRTLVDSLDASLRVLGEQKGLSFTVDIDPNLPKTLLADEDALRKIITNLVSNGFKFTERGGVSLTIAPHDEQLMIVVKDTGIGIPAHMHEVIFESFRQVDPSTTRVYGGSGLGLAIVRNLCHAMNGTVSIESAPGAGSTFTVMLPILEDTTDILTIKSAR